MTGDIDVCDFGGIENFDFGESFDPHFLVFYLESIGSV